VIQGVFKAVERFLLPNCCVVCSRPVGESDPDALVCVTCRSRLRPIPAGCKRCSQPLPPVGPCQVCKDWPVGFAHATSAVWLGEEAREIVHHLKYEGFTRLAAVAAASIAQHASPPPVEATLIPIPLGVKRSFERGYNQAEEIAVALRKIWAIPVAKDVIRRFRETASQTSLTPQERVENVNAAFRAIHPVTTATNVAILVDDVFTTGATLSAAASALLDAGWREVHAVTFARALTFAVRVESQC